MMLKEKRRHPRLKERLPVEISCNFAAISTETKNISCSGAYCPVDITIPVMSKVKITMMIPFKKDLDVIPKKIVCDGIVLRCEPFGKDQLQAKWNIAIMFTEISKNDKDIIANYVKHQLAKLEEQ